MRNIIFHYHFFKNAGTSVDAFLKQNFPGQWATREFSSGQYAVNAAECQAWMRQEANIIAFSSHTALLPPPEAEDWRILPIVFFRHPIDRIASAYTFERIQGADTKGSILARQTTLKGYVEAHLAQGRYSQCRNFHVSRLAHMFTSNAGGDQSELAVQALGRLPFVGLVEAFDLSMTRLTDWLAAYFPGIKNVNVSKNVKRDHTLPLEEKLGQIRAELGFDCYQQLLKANADDMALYDFVRQHYGR